MERSDDDLHDYMTSLISEANNAPTEKIDRRDEFLAGNHPAVPRVVYHGTLSDIPAFSISKTKAKQLGFHFGNQPQAHDFASRFSNLEDYRSNERPNIMPVHLSLKNPVRLRDEGDWGHKEIIPQLEAQGKINRDYAMAMSRKISMAHPLDQTPMLQNMLRGLGYDGAYYLNRMEGLSPEDRKAVGKANGGMNLTDEEFQQRFPSAGFSFIAFDPGQVKSASGNRGTYDMTEDDITKSRGGALDLARAVMAKKRAAGAPPSPSKFMPGVPRAVHADGGAVVSINGQPVDNDYVPAKTVKAYKLFNQRNGKLYPLFVGASKPVETGRWLAAEAGPEGKAPGKVKSKLGDLAYRPGWHAGDLPIATHIGGNSTGVPGGKPDFRPAHQVWAEVEMADDVDWQARADATAKKAITDQVPYGGHYRFKTNPNMTGNWLIGGHMKVNRVLDDEEVSRINSAAGVADLPRQKPARARGGKVGNKHEDAYRQAKRDLEAHRVDTHRLIDRLCDAGEDPTDHPEMIAAMEKLGLHEGKHDALKRKYHHG